RRRRSLLLGHDEVARVCGGRGAQLARAMRDRSKKTARARWIGPSAAFYRGSRSKGKVSIQFSAKQGDFAAPLSRGAGALGGALKSARGGEGIEVRGAARARSSARRVERGSGRFVDAVALDSG